MLQKEECPKEKQERRGALSERLTEIQRINDPEMRCNKAHALLEEITAIGATNPEEKRGKMHEKDVIPVMGKLLEIIDKTKEHIQDPELLAWLEGDLKMLRSRYNAILSAAVQAEEKADETYRASARHPLVAEGEIYRKREQKKRAG